MKTKKLNMQFTIEADTNDSGMVGAFPLRFRGWDSFVPTFRLSHEIIDHRSGEFGAIYQEIEALGAICFLRGFEIEEGFYAGKCRSEFIASDFTSIYRDADYGSADYRIMSFPEYKKISLTVEEKEKFAILFENLRERTAELWASEVNQDCENEDIHDTHEDCDYCSENWFFENWENVKNALMFGFANAKKRWDGFNHWSLRRSIDEAMKQKERFLQGYE